MLPGLDVDSPVLAAPMAGGPSTPELVRAATQAGGLGFLAGGYRTPDALAAQVDEIRAAGGPFGVNLFAPNPVPVDGAEFRAYARAVQTAADRYGLTLDDQPTEDDDHWDDKVAMLVADPVPLVSFTFGVPDRAAVALLRTAGSTVLQTVTSVAEARVAVEAGVDGLVVQAAAAGGHSATLTPSRLPEPTPLPDLVAQVRHAVDLPVVAAGGIATATNVTAALTAGATAVLVGTALLRTSESGTSATHRAALADAGRETVLTRAFTGRPARALRNEFVDRYDPVAPSGYPALHHLTSPLRKAAAAAGDTEVVHLWAGTGYRSARAESAVDTLTRLAASSSR